MSKNVVLAGEDNLEELLVGESVVAVAIEELDEVEGLALRDVVAGVVSQEVDDLE